MKYFVTIAFLLSVYGFIIQRRTMDKYTVEFESQQKNLTSESQIMTVENIVFAKFDGENLKSVLKANSGMLLSNNKFMMSGQIRYENLPDNNIKAPSNSAASGGFQITTEQANGTFSNNSSTSDDSNRLSGTLKTILLPLQVDILSGMDRLKTHNVSVDLPTQNLTTSEPVTLTGHGAQLTGRSMAMNMRDNTIAMSGPISGYWDTKVRKNLTGVSHAK